MAEFCRKCFIETFHPNSYDRHHIVMSKDSELCEGCLDYVPCVERIDMSDCLNTPMANDLIQTIIKETKAGHKIACTECGAVFEEDDLAFVCETGSCQYCHKDVRCIWIRE